MNVEENPLAVSLDKGAAAESLKKRRSRFKGEDGSSRSKPEDAAGNRFYQREGFDRDAHANQMGGAMAAITGTPNPYANSLSESTQISPAPSSNLVELGEAFLLAQKNRGSSAT
jgi:hypothetical protein